MKIAAQDFNVQLGASNPGETVLMGGTAAAGSAIVVPGGTWPLQSEFLRQGPDLLISGKAGESYIVRDYFLDGNQAQIQTEGGAVLPASLVERLVKVTAAGQYAQSAGTDSAEIVGRVETVLGKASALRNDGSQLELTAGDAIHAGDILQTSPDASLGIVFADKTTLSLGSEGRLVVDNFVYDPQANVGSMNVSVVQGVFTFVSGEIAKLGPDMMTVYTPVATIGIRGTKVAGRAAAEGEQNTISLLPNDDGSVGVIAVGNQSGAVP
ncbi:MAG: FecR domain-containing protein, partial [Rickettsiales bacterium]